MRQNITAAIKLLHSRYEQHAFLKVKNIMDLTELLEQMLMDIELCRLKDLLNKKHNTKQEQEYWRDSIKQIKKSLWDHYYEH